MKRKIRVHFLATSCLRFVRPVWLALVLASFAANVSRAATVSLNVMTFNIKFDDGSIGNQFNDNGWVVNKFYVPTGNRRDKIRLLGNGVCPPVMEAVISALQA